MKKLETKDFNIINGVLRTANSIFKRHSFPVSLHTNNIPQISSFHEIANNLGRTQVYIDNLSTTIIGSVSSKILVAVAMLTRVQATNTFIDQTGSSNSNALVVLFKSLKLMLKIFYSLNAIDLPEFFEDHMNDYMTLFRKYLLFPTTDTALIGDEVY